MNNDVVTLNNNLNQQGAILSVSGPISQNIIVEIGGTLKEKMKRSAANTKIMHKVFSVIIEQAQNINHYSAEKMVATERTDMDNPGVGILVVGYQEGHYYVSSGNMIDNKNADMIRKKLSRLQHMTKDELKSYYHEQRKTGDISKNNSAGLGFIEIARKVYKPVEFCLKKLNDNKSFFTLKAVI